MKLWKLKKWRCFATHIALGAIVHSNVIAALALLLLGTLSVATAAQQDQTTTYRILLLHSFRNRLPVTTDWYDGIVQGFNSAPELRIEIDIEAPDLARFKDADYISNVLAIYRHKYQDDRPHLIIPTYTPALRFLLQHGENLFPGIPIVFSAADSQFVAAQNLAPHITGITSRLDIAGTLELALGLHPGVQRVALIVGSGNIGKLFEHQARQVLQPFADKLDFIWLRGMPLAELSETVSNLPADTVILYLVQVQDRAGIQYVPVNYLPQLAAAANAPIYGLWDTLLGHGIIGGRLATLKGDGFQTAQLGLRILRGEAPAAIAVVDRKENRAIFDDRELARWNIDEDRLPAGSRILHEQLTFWETHGMVIITAVLIIVLQSLLIAALLLSRARLQRIRAALRDEVTQRRQMGTMVLELRERLARFSKERTLGTMATGIAHEINQPLIAIQNYVQAATRRLQSGSYQTPKLIELFAKIEQQAGRAGDIIRHIRVLLSTDTADLHPTPLWPLIEQVIQLLQPEIESRGCHIDYCPGADLPAVLADELEIQLVLANLLHNAMDSMQTMENPADKRISINIRQINEQEIQVSVADRGHGIPPDRVADIFEPLYSGSQAGMGMGMGMGLAICRTIIDAHDGRISYSPNPSGGAIFQFTLLLAVE